MATYSIILLVALIGNVLIISVFSKYKPLRKSMNYFVVNMAVSDLFTPLTIMPFIIAQTLSSRPFLSESRLHPELANIFCKLCYFLPNVSVLVSIQSLMLISVDRLIAVVFPLKIKLATRQARLVCILVSWIVAIGVHAHYLHIFRVSPNGYSCINFKADWTAETHYKYLVAMFIVFYLVPLCLLTIIYSTIAWTLKRRQNQRRRMSKWISKRSLDLTRNRQILRLSVAILAAFIVCIGPLFVFSFIIIFKFHGKPPTEFEAKIPSVILFIIKKMLVHSWGALNPCICFAFSENYRTGFKHLVFGRRRASRNSLSTISCINVTLVRRRTKRSSNSDHVMISMKTVAERQRLKHVGARTEEQGQKQDNGNKVEEITREENVSLL